MIGFANEEEEEGLIYGDVGQEFAATYATELFHRFGI